LNLISTFRQRLVRERPTAPCQFILEPLHVNLKYQIESTIDQPTAARGDGRQVCVLVRGRAFKSRSEFLEKLDLNNNNNDDGYNEDNNNDDCNDSNAK